MVLHKQAPRLCKEAEEEDDHHKKKHPNQKDNRVPASDDARLTDRAVGDGEDDLVPEGVDGWYR